MQIILDYGQSLTSGKVRRASEKKKKKKKKKIKKKKSIGGEARLLLLARPADIILFNRATDFAQKQGPFVSDCGKIQLRLFLFVTF